MVQAYVRGEPLRALMERFNVSRATVFAYMKRHGVTQYRNGPRFTADDARTIHELYATGLSLSTIAARHHTDAATVRNTLLRHGYATRPRGEQHSQSGK